MWTVTTTFRIFYAKRPRKGATLIKMVGPRENKLFEGTPAQLLKADTYTAK